jgi:sugar phosphate isomerase/epimerase
MAGEQDHQLGISSWSFPWAVGVSRGPRLKRRLSALELLEKAKALDVGLVQIADNLPLEDLPWESLIKVKRFAGENNIKIETGTRGTNTGHLMKFLEIAHFLKSPVLRVAPTSDEEPFDPEKIQRDLWEVLPDFGKENVMIVLENHEAFTALELAGLMERFDHPCLRVCLDLSNSIGALEGPDHVLDRLAPWCGCLIFRDVEIVRTQTSMGFSVEGRPAGMGRIPIGTALGRLKELGIGHNTIVELWPPWQGDIQSTVSLENEWAALSVEFMKNLD